MHGLGLLAISLLPPQFLIRGDVPLFLLSLVPLAWSSMDYYASDLKAQKEGVQWAEDSAMQQRKALQALPRVRGSRDHPVTGAEDGRPGPRGPREDAPERTRAWLPPHASAPSPYQRKDYPRARSRELNSLHAGYAIEQTATDHLFVLAATAIGTSHDQNGAPREDALAFAAKAHDNSVVCAVADGLGSTRFAHVVSSLAARSAVDALLTLAEKGVRWSHAEWLEDVRKILYQVDAILAADQSRDHAQDPVRLAGDYGEGRRDTGKTTLLAAIVERDGQALRCAWFSIGDSELAVLNTDAASLEWLTDRDRHGGPVDRTLPGAVGVSKAGISTLTAGSTLLLASDGMADVMSAGLGPIAEAIGRAQHRLGAIPELAAAVDQRVIGVNDDRSVVAVGQLR